MLRDAVSGRGHRAFATLILCAVLAACSSLSGYPPEPADPDAELASLQKYFAPDLVTNYHDSTDAVLRKHIRDEVVYGRLRAYDIEFKKFEKALAGDNNTFSIGSEWVVLGLNAAGAVTGGAGTKAALAAASAGIVGAEGVVDKDLFYQKTIPALLAAMEAGRLKALVPIKTGLGKSDADYSLDQALVDLGAYDTAGSIPDAITGIVNDAGASASTSQQAIINIARDASFLNKLPDATAIQARLKALTAAQALALAKIMADDLKNRSKSLQDLVKAIDPKGQWLTNGDAAKQVLLAWQINDDRDAASMKQWTDALSIVEKVVNK